MNTVSELSLTGARWVEREAEAGRIQALAEATGLSPAAARVLALRHPGNAHEAEEWLRPSFEHLHDPGAMLNMEAAVDRLRRALADRERLRVVTDYDVDGTTSSLILQATLKILDPHVRLDYHIPNRFGEGYGFSSAAAERAGEDDVGLVITADIGVRDHASVHVARNAGVDVLICDHHLPAGAEVPDGATVLCPPQAGCGYPNRGLAACGVSLKLAQALLADHPKRDAILRSMLKLAAIGTVADMVPLDTLENRAIVTLGLQELNEGRHHAGLAALIDVSGLQAGRIRPTDLGFRLGPRINAAGRVADATLVVELLTTREQGEAGELAQRLDGLNQNRKEIQRRLVKEALAQIGEEPDPFVVLSGPEEEGWHRGVVGIVAARVKDEVHRPVAIVSVQGERAVGSVRSVPSVHAVHALDSASDLLVKYGGHPGAAGFTVRTEDLPELRSRLCDYMSRSAEEAQLVPEHRVDGELQGAEVGRALQQELGTLGPFGQANPAPRFAIPAAKLSWAKRAGEAHLRFTATDGAGGKLEAICFRAFETELGAFLEQRQGRPVHLAGRVEIDDWGGRRRAKLRVEDAADA